MYNTVNVLALNRNSRKQVVRTISLGLLKIISVQTENCPFGVRSW